MYAVGLGAAILTQFRLEDTSVVRVLADGGMGHGAYAANGVLLRLDAAINAFGGGERRIDLIVGTHYDGDHLKGLVPIAKDDSLEIGEVWLPPIRDDSGEVQGHISEESAFLVHRLYEDGGEEVLMKYLRAKYQEIQELNVAEQTALESLRGAEAEFADSRELPLYRSIPRGEEFRALRERPRNAEEFLRFFEAEERHAAHTTGSEGAHGAAVYNSQAPDIREVARERYGYPRFSDLRERVAYMAKSAPLRLRMLPGLLATVRKSTAHRAITASHLEKLVSALKHRASPVRPKCQYIKQGNPFRFSWDSRRKRFIARAPTESTALSLELLGPCDTRVDKYRERISVGSYAEALALYRAPIALEGITASNELSYIFVLQAKKQRILISGDSGCHDFREGAGESLHTKLLEALAPLHIVQVAHHAGHNYDFYNCLLEADLARQRGMAYLLLSHDYHDATRPSDAFRRFIAELRSEGKEDISLLFTSEPVAKKVEDFDELIAAVEPPGAGKKTGDIRLVFEGLHDTQAWRVEAHAIRVP